MQPTLHDKELIFVAPTQMITDKGGWISRDGEGVFHSDIRTISHLSLIMDARVDCVATNYENASTLTQRYIIRGVGETRPDPEIILTRRLTVYSGRVHDELEFQNVGTETLSFDFAIRIESDLARLDSVKMGRDTEIIEPVHEAKIDGRPTLVWDNDLLEVRATVAGLQDAPVTLLLKPGQTKSFSTNLVITEKKKLLFSSPIDPHMYLPNLEISVKDKNLHRAVIRSLDDLRSLLLIDGKHGNDAFLAAGAPWYFTLFGRDSIWSALFLLPMGTEVALGTLRTLARRQAVSFDPMSQAEPGKMLHEVREEEIDLDNGITLPPIYYGSIDSTPLWISLLHAAWKYGAPEDEIKSLLPNLESALAWMEKASSRDGFLRYIDSSGKGLANQGWKDSADGIRHRDGSLGEPPIALCEVQGYAFAAANHAVELLRHFGIGNPDHWENWASDLSDRFRKNFWVSTSSEKYPAVALDRQMKPISALTSNIGHLLGTGICNEEEVSQIARLLTQPDLNSGFGLRTMAASTGGFNPLGYHTGSVWSHDTMIVARGLAIEGFREQAIALAREVIDVSTHFAGRLPELHGGYPSSEGTPTAYAASCRPQAWSAAATIEALRIYVGLNPNVPQGYLEVAFDVPDAVLGLDLESFFLGGQPVSIRINEENEFEVETKNLTIIQIK